MRSLVSLVAALALGWSSVVDNPVVCPDDGPATDSSRPCNDGGAPATPCVSCPCHLPLRLSAAVAVGPPVWLEVRAASWPVKHVHAADLAAPPTPPPLA
jgi:hypothetical protein